MSAPEPRESPRDALARDPDGFLADGVDAIRRGMVSLRSDLEIPEDLDNVAWTERHFYLSPETAGSRQLVRWFGYQKPFLQEMSNPDCEILVAPKSTRTGFTQIIAADSSFEIRHRRNQVMNVQPTDLKAQEFSNDYVQPASRGPKGKDAINYVGVYSPTAIYEPGDAVLVDPDSMQLWRALIRPPAGKGPGTFADDAAHTPYWTSQSYPVFDTEEINHSVRGAFGASSQVFRRRFARSGKFLPNLVGAVGYCDVAPTNAVTFNLTLGGAVPNAMGTTIGQLRFAAGSRVATFTMTAGANLSIVPGGQFFVISPSSVDPTLSGLEFAIPYNVIGETVAAAA